MPLKLNWNLMFFLYFYWFECVFFFPFSLFWLIYNATKQRDLLYICIFFGIRLVEHLKKIGTFAKSFINQYNRSTIGFVCDTSENGNCFEMFRQFTFVEMKFIVNSRHNSWYYSNVTEMNSKIFESNNEIWINVILLWYIRFLMTIHSHCNFVTSSKN